MRRWRVPAGGALVALLLVAVYFMAFHQPRSNEIATLGEDATRLDAESAALQRTITALEKVAAREPEFAAALRLLERLIPAGLAQPALLAHVQQAAQGAGVELVSVTFGDPKVPEKAPENAVAGTVLVAMPVTVVVSGPFGGITDMLRRIETEKQRAVLVRNVALTEAKAGFPQLTATWSGQAYALLPAGDPLLIDRSAPAATVRSTPEERVTP